MGTAPGLARSWDVIRVREYLPVRGQNRYRRETGSRCPRLPPNKTKPPEQSAGEQEKLGWASWRNEIQMWARCRGQVREGPELTGTCGLENRPLFHSFGGD